MSEKQGWGARFRTWVAENVVAPRDGFTQPSSVEDRLLDQSLANKRDFALKGTLLADEVILTDQVRKDIENGILEIKPDGTVGPKE
jgi:hypothetical protein